MINIINLDLLQVQLASLDMKSHQTSSICDGGVMLCIFGSLC